MPADINVCIALQRPSGMYSCTVLVDSAVMFGIILPIGDVLPMPKSPKAIVYVGAVVDPAARLSRTLLVSATHENGNLVCIVVGNSDQCESTCGFGIKRYEIATQSASPKMFPVCVHALPISASVVVAVYAPHKAEDVAMPALVVAN